jgi:hypothetical protein
MGPGIDTPLTPLVAGVRNALVMDCAASVPENRLDRVRSVGEEINSFSSVDASIF